MNTSRTQPSAAPGRNSGDDLKPLLSGLFQQSLFGRL